MIKLNIPRLELLTRNQLKDIHNATLEVLQRTGVVFKHENALKVFNDAGAYIDYKAQRVFIPSYLVEEALRKAPCRFTWYARNPKKSIKFENDKIHFGPVCTPAFVYDLETGQKRDATKTDFENIVRIMDYLDRVDDGYGSVHIRDVPDHASHAYAILLQIKNTDKPIRGRARGTTIAKDCLNMMSMVAGNEEELMKRPMLICMINPSSPLQWDRVMIEGMMEYSRLRQIVIPSPEVMAGATGPVTLAGTIVQHNAEVLSMITLMQLMYPGTPVMYGAVSTIMDMKTATPRLGGPELGIMHVCLAQLAKMYGIPSRGAAGNTDAKILDMQAGCETTFNLVLATLAGFNFITYALGSIDFSLSICYEKILIDHELLGMIERLAKGVQVTDDTLAVDIIDSVGPGGHFLSQKHTREYHLREHFIPHIFDTSPYESWLRAGGKEVRNKAKEEVKRILREHTSPSLDKDLENKLEEYVKRVERRA
ncbi:MAG: trimethylamine methyltransferase family protein [Nitrososphaeria archaeon]